MNETGESFLADAALADDQDGRIDSSDASGEADQLLHDRAVHTETRFAIGSEPLEVWVLHRPLNDTSRHRTGSEAVFSC